MVVFYIEICNSWNLFHTRNGFGIVWTLPSLELLSSGLQSRSALNGGKGFRNQFVAKKYFSSCVSVIKVSFLQTTRFFNSYSYSFRNNEKCTKNIAYLILLFDVIMKTFWLFSEKFSLLCLSIGPAFDISLSMRLTISKIKKYKSDSKIRMKRHSESSRIQYWLSQTFRRMSQKQFPRIS
jgi:hypothetical protein